MHVVSRVTHRFAHETPAPAAKQVAYAISNAGRHAARLPARWHAVRSRFTVRRHVFVAALNGCGGIVVVVVLVVVVAVCAMAILARPSRTTAAPNAMALGACMCRLLPRTSRRRRAGSA